MAMSHPIYDPDLFVNSFLFVNSLSFLGSSLAGSSLLPGALYASRVRVTHRFHPLFGRELEFVKPQELRR